MPNSIESEWREQIVTQLRELRAEVKSYSETMERRVRSLEDSRLRFVTIMISIQVAAGALWTMIIMMVKR